MTSYLRSRATAASADNAARTTPLTLTSPRWGEAKASARRLSGCGHDGRGLRFGVTQPRDGDGGRHDPQLLSDGENDDQHEAHRGQDRHEPRQLERDADRDGGVTERRWQQPRT